MLAASSAPVVAEAEATIVGMEGATVKQTMLEHWRQRARISQGLEIGRAHYRRRGCETQKAMGIPIAFCNLLASPSRTHGVEREWLSSFR